MASNKGDIGWKRRTEEGERVQVSAKKVGNRWLFRFRDKRYDTWQAYDEPSLEDWLELLDNVKRRIDRKKIPFDEKARLIATIRERYPEATL